MDEPLSEPILRFLADHIGTIHDLEVLALVCRDRRGWTVRELAVALATSEAAVLGTVETFVAKGLLTQARPGVYTCGDVGEPVQRALDAYAQRRVAVISAIYGTSPGGTRVRELPGVREDDPADR